MTLFPELRNWGHRDGTWWEIYHISRFFPRIRLVEGAESVEDFRDGPRPKSSVKGLGLMGWVRYRSSEFVLNGNCKCDVLTEYGGSVNSLGCLA